ncbi:Vacuolar protein sorting-associated protein 53 [Ascosphaera aggregata]|nr:Vacuolar protein sorting-associated protein 53 [Ascosphaera aggregata]
MSDIISPPPSSFTRRLNTSFQKVDNLLKVIQVRPSPPETLVQAYLLHIADKSESNFKRVLDIKGIRSKTEQSQLTELFHVHRASNRYATSLQTSNPLIANLANASTASLTGPISSTASSSATNTTTSAAAINVNTSSASSTIALHASGSFPGLSSVIVSGVERFGSPVLGGGGTSSSQGVMTPTQGTFDSVTSTVAQSGGGTINNHTSSTTATAGAGTTGTTDSTGTGSATAGNLNENLRSIGKFFRRDLGGLGGRFGRSADTSGSSR